MSTLPGRMEVAVHTAREKYPPSLRGAEDVLYIGGDRPMPLPCDKQDELSRDRANDMGSGV
jgi:hypothetical protein